ncbi:hypothetical protein POM88_022216 [Heracleum sosnowskyi]|uniref:Uncharacterized protein n=1 Tax=Heracleum sosnowskyi TaxID=360622 RepID=A0AAD8MTA9_9APIA|nr:hypothetical protein POM88_022216 [Heracleum sosnowskyi]
MPHLVAATNKKLSLEGKMVSDSTTRAVAAEAGSQLVFSIISNSPPSDMSRNYFYTYAERGFNYLEKQLKRLERYKYKLGTKNIQNRMRYNKLFVQANEGENQLGIEHIRAWARSIKQSKVLQENEDENRQGIEHIRYPLISSKHSEVVQENEDEHQQGNEHFPNSPRSVLYSEVVLANEDEYQQGIEHIQYCLISSKHSEVVQTNEDVNHQGIEHIHDCLRSSKHYHEVELLHED